MVVIIGLGFGFLDKMQLPACSVTASELQWVFCENTVIWFCLWEKLTWWLKVSGGFCCFPDEVVRSGSSCYVSSLLNSCLGVPWLHMFLDVGWICGFFGQVK